MTGALCLFFTLWLQSPSTDKDPAALVAQLGSMKYAEREAAAEALEQIGRTALPALRLAQDSKDLEIRTRSISIIRKIEGSLLTQPTMLRLAFKDSPLGDVVKSLSEQSGIKIGLIPESNPRFKSEKLTLQVGEPIPFWKGIDLICQATQLRPNPGMIAGHPGREPTFSLVAGAGQPNLPSSDHGPFRVNLNRLHSERDVSFGLVPPANPIPVGGRQTLVDPAATPAAQLPKPVVQVQFNFQLQVFAEPRLSVNQSGTVKMLEAQDELGNSLLAQSASAVEHQVMVGRFARPFAGGGVVGQQLMLTVPLKRPETPGHTIKLLKGVIPVQVASKRPDPLVVALADSTGKTVENRETSVVVHSVKKIQPQGQTTIEMTVRNTSSGTVPDLRNEPNNGPDSFVVRSDGLQQQIEILDAEGRFIPWFQTLIDPDSSRMTITLTPFRGANIEPKEIRFYSLIKAITEIPFEFRDLPMP